MRLKISALRPILDGTKHWAIHKCSHIKIKDRYHKHEPSTVTENNSITIFWDISKVGNLSQG